MVKTTIVVLVVGFLIFYVVSSPDQAANIVHDVWNLAVSAAHGIGSFFNQLAT